MSDNKIKKEFVKRDVFYNNGLVNLKRYLDEYSVNGLIYELNSKSLILEFSDGNDETYYNELLKGFIENNKIVFHTDNERLYWDKDNKCFMYHRKYDVKGKSSGNDVKNLYKYITPSEIGCTTEELYNNYIEFAKTNKQVNLKEDTKIFKKDGSFKKENQCKIPIFMIMNEAVESYIEYSFKGNLMNFDSKIHQFEDGGFCFRDMLTNKGNYIDKWDALIYWYGVKMQRYFNSVYFIYVNSNDLLALYEMKKELDINDDSIKVKDEKKGGVKNIPTNLDISSQLIEDAIINENFYISNSISEFQLKFFMYITSKIYHIENTYEATDEERTKRRKEKLYNSLKNISFVTYTEDGNMKSSLEEYTKVYKMCLFLRRLLENEYLDSTMFKYFAKLITTLSLSKNEQEKNNLNIKKFCENILKFADLRKVYYDVSFKILKSNKRNFGTDLFYFEDMYLQETQRGDYIMSLHSKSKKIGEEIGVFSANLEDKDLLFKLRNVKNHIQLVTYFKDLKFAVLKKQTESRFSNEFNKIMEEIFEEMEKEPSNWELIRDYIAIYSIDKYKAVLYKKQEVKGGK